MSIKSLMKVGGVTMATVGLTMCNMGGVDPAPGPLQCSSLGDGMTLQATATLSGSKLKVEVSDGSFLATWKGTPSLSKVTGATVDNISVNGTTVTIILDVGRASDAGGADSGDAMADAGLSPSGSFTFTGQLTDGTVSCGVTRTFHFEIIGNSASVALLDEELPLRLRDPASIEVIDRRDREVELRAIGAREGDAVVWTATAGNVHHGEDSVRWQLPSEPGLYQIEVLVDRGKDGVSLDTLTLEVA
jgi:hypothetical protein